MFVNHVYIYLLFMKAPQHKDQVSFSSISCFFFFFSVNLFMTFHSIWALQWFFFFF